MIHRVSATAEAIAAISSSVQEFGDGWSLRLLLRTAADGAAVERALLAGIEDLERREALGEPIDAPRNWDWSETPEGLVVLVRGDEGTEQALSAICETLAAHGIDGTFELAAIDPQQPPPIRAPMLAASLRIRGDRRSAHGGYQWQAHHDAWRLALTAVLPWAQGASEASRRSTVGWTAITDQADAHRQMLAALEAGDMAAHVGIAGRIYRAVGVGPQGYINLVAGVWPSDDLPWRALLDELVDAICRTSDQLAYAFVMRGTDVSHFLANGRPSSVDWRERTRPRPVGPGWTSTSFDDLFVADIHGVQLFGPGYADRSVTSPHWATRPLGQAQLVTHTDPASWFEQPLFPTEPRPTEVPAALNSARADLDAFLYRPGRLRRRGFKLVQ